MNFHPNEIVLIYNPESEKDKQTLAYAKSINRNIREIDVTKTTLTATSWDQVLDIAHLEPKEIMDRSSDFYESNVKGREIDPDGMIKILNHNPKLLAGPIAIHGHRAILCKNPTDIMKIK